MLTLFTGLPGHGKSLFAIDHVEKLRQESGRPVYYWNVKGLTLPWTALGNAETFDSEKVEPDQSEVVKWYDLPVGSIIVMDECQHLFRPRKQGSELPTYISNFETHRHKGFDIFLITQDPTFIDTHIRKLVGKHFFLKRVFGLHGAHVFEWARCALPNSRAEYRDCRDYRWKYPKEVFSYYKSSQLHTVKKDLPWMQFGMIAAGILFMICAVMYVFSGWGKKEEGAAASDKTTHSDAPPVPKGKNPWSPELRQPRMEGWQMSAPYYDNLQRVLSQPKVAGCAQLRVGARVDCSCTTSQGFKLAISTHECLQLVRDGWFDPTRPEKDIKAENIAYLNSRDRAGVAAREVGQTAKQDAQETPGT